MSTIGVVDSDASVVAERWHSLITERGELVALRLAELNKILAFIGGDELSDRKDFIVKETGFACGDGIHVERPKEST